jgi:PAS domain S-box-containing protein
MDPSAPAGQAWAMRDFQTAILESAIDPIVVIDAEGRVREFNRAAERTFGYARSAALGEEMAALLMPSRFRDAHRRGLARAVQTGQGALLGRRLEMIGLRADGSEFPVELTLTMTGADGALFFTGYLRDISQQKNAEQSLLDQARLATLAADVGATLTRAERLQDMLQGCAQAVVARLDAAFARIWTLNESEQVLELQASAGMYTHLDGPHGRVPVGQFKIGLIAAERKPHLTNHVVGDPRVGDQAWARRESMVAFAGYPLMIGDEIVGVLAMFSRRTLSDTDFAGLATVAQGIALGIARQRGVEALRERADQLARLYSALERTNRELDQFAYVASHDLKAPLRGIANLSQWIEEDLGSAVPSSTRQHLDLLRGRVHRMEALIDGILEYSRAGRVLAAAERVATRDLVRDIGELLSVPPDVRFAIADNLPVVTTERLPLQQVLMNLIANAIKYRRPGGGATVSINSEPVDGGHAFTVRDNGPGIAPAFQDRIWGIFQTLEPRDKVEGTGIGLALVKKIVEGRGGRVWVESAEGQGAAFGFTWPSHAKGRES